MRVALCLYGLIGGDEGKGGAGSSGRTIGLGYEHYKKHLIDVNEQVDVFVHSWSVDHMKEVEKLYLTLLIG